MVLAICAAKLRRGLDQQPEDDCTIIIGEIDQPCLGDKTAKFDQLSRAFATLHLPVASVMPSARQQQPILRRHCLPRHRQRFQHRRG